MEDSKNITLKVNSKLYDTYGVLCKEEGWIVSRQFEKFIEEELKKMGRARKDAEKTFGIRISSRENYLDLTKKKEDIKEIK